MKTVYYFIMVLFINPAIILSQNAYQIDPDTVRPTEYRRGIEIPPGYQSYEKKYQGKDLNEERKRLFPLESTGIWTELNPKIPRITYAGIYFVNKDTGWAVGDLGAVIKTTDGGENWRVIQTNTVTPILKIRSYNGQIVIAGGYNGLILRSTDGGESFSEIASGLGTGYDLWGLELVDDTLGWACGATGLIKTTDAGESWQIVNTPGFTGNLWWIDFMNKDYGFIAADGNVLRTTDGGENWEIIPAGDYRPLYCLDIIDSLHIAAAGYGGTSYSAKNLYSSDGGYTWISGGNLTTEEVNCIQYVNPDTGYLVMSGVSARKTTNRGQEWTTLQGISDNYEIQILNNNIGYSAGTEVKICKAEGDLDQWHRLFINDNFSDVFFVNEQKGFVISSAENSNYRGLYKTTNGGESWQSVPGAPNGVDLLFLDSLTGLLGANSSIYRTTDGGDSWYQTQGAAGGGKIIFINQTTGWAVHSNVIYKTTDRGENWFVQFTAPSSTSFRSINFVDSLYGWTAGSDRPYKTTDGGDNWIQQTNLDIWQSRDVFFTNRNLGWIVDETSWRALKKTIDGGVNWETVPEILDPYNFNFFPDPIHWMINGSHQYLTLDSGSSWIDITDDVPTGFNRFQAPTNIMGYAVGNSGLILKYIDTIYTPVELIDFSSESDGQNVILKWLTGTETNNKGYEVQRKVDGSYWETVGFIAGSGTTTIPNSYSYTDKNVITGKYYYRLKQIDFDGRYVYSQEIEVNVIAPNRFSLEQNYPNPFNPVTKIDFCLAGDSKVNLKIYDMLGREIQTLANKVMKAGYYNIEFNASTLPSGVYFYQLRVEGDGGDLFNSIKKMTFIK